LRGLGHAENPWNLRPINFVQIIFQDFVLEYLLSAISAMIAFGFPRPFCAHRSRKVLHQLLRQVLPPGPNSNFSTRRAQETYRVDAMVAVETLVFDGK
jgi:hypothetical protein